MNLAATLISRKQSATFPRTTREFTATLVVTFHPFRWGRFVEVPVAKQTCLLRSRTHHHHSLETGLIACPRQCPQKGRAHGEPLPGRTPAATPVRGSSITRRAEKMGDGRAEIDSVGCTHDSAGLFVNHIFHHPRLGQYWSAHGPFRMSTGGSRSHNRDIIEFPFGAGGSIAPSAVARTQPTPQGRAINA